MDNNEWRDARRDANRVGKFSLGWVLLIILVVVAVSAAIWGITVAVSGVKGQGDAVIEKNSADNWIAAQAEFERGYQDILSTDQKIMLAYNNLQTAPDDNTLRTNYTGLQSYCLSAVAEYNANARSYLSEDFRAADLPDIISTTNPATDCKE